MKITIDGKRRSFDSPGDVNLGVLLQIIYEEIRKDGRLVHRITLDGEEISPEKEDALASARITDFDKLEIGTSTHREVAKESIVDSLAFIDHIVKEFRKVVRGLRDNDLESFRNKLMESLQDLSDFVELFSSIKAMSSVDTRKINIDGKRVEDLETLMLSAIKETVSTDQGEGIDHTINSIEMILIPVLDLFKRCILEIDRLMETDR
jgi:hypothetical protein